MEEPPIQHQPMGEPPARPTSNHLKPTRATSARPTSTHSTSTHGKTTDSTSTHSKSAQSTSTRPQSTHSASNSPKFENPPNIHPCNIHTQLDVRNRRIRLKKQNGGDPHSYRRRFAEVKFDIDLYMINPKTKMATVHCVPNGAHSST